MSRTHDIIRLLETELDLIEKGGYGRSPREPWKAKSMFQYSVACINHWFVPDHPPDKCDGCILLDYVPDEHKQKNAPCHFIPLNEKGETIDMLELTGDQSRLEETVKMWIQATLRDLKEKEARPEQEVSELVY
jgi:hypothetical protein